MIIIDQHSRAKCGDLSVDLNKHTSTIVDFGKNVWLSKHTRWFIIKLFVINDFCQAILHNFYYFSLLFTSPYLVMSFVYWLISRDQPSARCKVYTIIIIHPADQQTIVDRSDRIFKSSHWSRILIQPQSHYCLFKS